MACSKCGAVTFGCYLRLGTADGECHAAYRTLFRAHVDDQAVDEIRASTIRGLPLGNERFCEQVDAALGRRVGLNLVASKMRDWRMNQKWQRMIINALAIGWIIWLGGNWEDEFSPKYTPPRFDQLQQSVGVISFTRQSKSSGGEIVIRLASGNKLHLSCSSPYSLPSACYFKQSNGKQLPENYRDKLTGKFVTVWWMGEEKNSAGEDVGRVYQLRVGGELFFEYDEMLAYYIKGAQEGEGHNLYIGLILLILTIVFIVKYFRKR